MKKHTFQRRAPGGPGIEPRWTHGAKIAVGTVYSTSSRVWYTLDAGCVTEVYYPTIDTPLIRDLVWTRDLVKSVTGLLAAGDTSTPLRSLIYLAVSQREDGGFYQNFWLYGRPYWVGIQLCAAEFFDDRGEHGRRLRRQWDSLLPGESLFS